MCDNGVYVGHFTLYVKMELRLFSLFLFTIRYFHYLHFKFFPFPHFPSETLLSHPPLPMLTNPPTPTSLAWNSSTLGHQAFTKPRASPLIDVS